MSSYLSDSDKEHIIRKLYTNLMYYQDGELYFYDKSIDRFPIEDYHIGHKNYPYNYYYHFRVHTSKYSLMINTLVIFNRDHPIDLEYSSVLSHRGRLVLDLNYKLSDELCMVLYDYDLNILCKSDRFHYDRVGIERSCTIKNIING